MYASNKKHGGAREKGLSQNELTISIFGAIQLQSSVTVYEQGEFLVECARKLKSVKHFCNSPSFITE